MVVKASTELSDNWFKFMISRYRSVEHDIRRLLCYEEDGFDFAPAYTAWVPDDKGSFERLTAKVKSVNDLNFTF